MHNTDSRDHCRLDHPDLFAAAVGHQVTYHGAIRQLHGAVYTVTGYDPDTRCFTLERPRLPYGRLTVPLSAFRFTDTPLTGTPGETAAELFAALRTGRETVVTGTDGAPVAVVLTVAEYVALIEQARWGRN